MDLRGVALQVVCRGLINKALAGVGLLQTGHGLAQPRVWRVVETGLRAGRVGVEIGGGRLNGGGPLHHP